MSGNGIDPFVEKFLVKTHGNLYRGLDRVPRYPIPAFPLPAGEGRRLLDVGCNWGRWTIAASRAGWQATGIDPKRKAIDAARRVAEELGVEAEYVVGDARELPFADGTFDAVYSYSVLQHLAKDDARRAIYEIARVLKSGGLAWVEMPNARGPLNLTRLALRGFSGGRGAEVRYWTLAELRDAFSAIGPVDVHADGFFTLNPQPTDVDLLRRRHRAIVHVSETLRRASERVPALVRVADSVIVTAVAR